MQLRKLELKDAPMMFEWMHDENVTEKLQTEFFSKTIEDANSFIENSWSNRENLHLDIISDDDMYMGMVSLKHINGNSAEFAITVCRMAMGKGYAKYGMEAILDMALRDYGLKYVYWCVNPDNSRAVRFYEKNDYSKANYSDIYIGGGTAQSKFKSTFGLSTLHKHNSSRRWPIYLSGRVCE